MDDANDNVADEAFALAIVPDVMPNVPKLRRDRGTRQAFEAQFGLAGYRGDPSATIEDELIEGPELLFPAGRLLTGLVEVLSQSACRSASAFSSPFTKAVTAST